MSTSPSWFDQEKFSRLVKKVGPKPGPEAIPGQPGTEPENRSLPGEAPAPTSRISLVSKPPSLLSEHRALPALPRRTTSMPSLKGILPYSTPPRQSPFPDASSTEAPDSASPDPSEPGASTETIPGSEEVTEETGLPTNSTHEANPEGEELTAAWQKMSQLNEELAHAIQDRDQAVHESILLREQLRQADETLEGGSDAAPSEELARVVKERDDALAEGQALREHLRQIGEPAKEPGNPGSGHEVTFLAEERDQARRQYATLRKQFETLKLEQSPPREEPAKVRKDLEQQLEGFRQKLEEKNQEIVKLKASSGGPGPEDETLKQEMASLREQLARVKEEASVAQRGLALSQKALHETRDTLREATEGTSLSRHNFDNLKNECAILAQQNTVLQAQNDQLSRELSAAKSKLTTRL